MVTATALPGGPIICLRSICFILPVTWLEVPHCMVTYRVGTIIGPGGIYRHGVLVHAGLVEAMFEMVSGKSTGQEIEFKQIVVYGRGSIFIANLFLFKMAVVEDSRDRYVILPVISSSSAKCCRARLCLDSGASQSFLDGATLRSV